MIEYGQLSLEGYMHKDMSIGKQDSVYVLNSPDIFIGIICDGCTSVNGAFSNNHVGASLISEFLAIKINEQYKIENNVLKSIKIAISKANSLIKTITRKFNNDSQYVEEFKLRYFLMTFIGSVIVNNHVYIFGKGDCSYGFEDKKYTLENNDKLFLRSNTFRLYYENFVTKKPIWIASDGFHDSLLDQNTFNLFQSFISDNQTYEPISKKSNPAMRSFRRIIYNKNKKMFPDDISIITMKIKDL